MRALIFIVSLLSLLFRGEHAVYEGTAQFHSIQKEEFRATHVSAPLPEKAFSISEYADIDPFEDYHSGNDGPDDIPSPALPVNHQPSFQWFLAISGVLLPVFIKRTTVSPFVPFTFPSPIYITQQVLRI